MTKENWIEWQDKFSRTKRIYAYFLDARRCIFDEGDKIESAEFEDNNAMLKIRRYRGKTTEYLTIKRNEIAEIEYKC